MRVEEEWWPVSLATVLYICVFGKSKELPICVLFPFCQNITKNGGSVAFSDLALVEGLILPTRNLDHDQNWLPGQRCCGDAMY